MQVAETAGSQSKIQKFIEGHASYLLLTITNWQRVKICENSLHILKRKKWSYERYCPLFMSTSPEKKQERSASHRAIKIYQQPAHPTSDKTLSSYVYFLVISFSKSIWQPWICIFCPVNHLCLEMQVIRYMLNFDKRHECVRPSLSINHLIVTLGLVFVFGYL